MSAAILNMVLVLGAVQLTNRIDFTQPENILAARIAYVAAQAIILATCYLTLRRIQARGDTRELKYTEPSPPMSSDPGKRVVTTNIEYDSAQVMTLVRSTLTSVVVIGLLHYKWEFIQPLVLQAILPFKALYENKVVRIHLMGREAEGELKRPFAADNPFASMFDANGLATGDGATVQAGSRNEERKEKRRLEKEARKKE